MDYERPMGYCVERQKGKLFHHWDDQTDGNIIYIDAFSHS